VRVAVVGLGLIGGSIGLAARRRAAAYVCGYDPDAAVLARARELGAIDEPATDLAAGVGDADAVFVAAPVGALARTIADVLEAAPARSVVSDVGSTKFALATSGFDRRFIGGHPLAGAETAGIEHAREDLFEGATWYLTPGAQTPRALALRLQSLLVELGARPAEIEPGAHDRMMARVSHLPHVFANLLASQAARVPEVSAGSLGPSFRDATRVAGANTKIWTDIFLSNREALLAAIDESAEALASVRSALSGGDRPALAAWHQQAHEDRARLLREDSGNDS
jgi:prephenate dehydrogenase